MKKEIMTNERTNKQKVKFLNELQNVLTDNKVEFILVGGWIQIDGIQDFNGNSINFDEDITPLSLDKYINKINKEIKSEKKK